MRWRKENKLHVIFVYDPPDGHTEAETALRQAIDTDPAGRTYDIRDDFKLDTGVAGMRFFPIDKSDADPESVISPLRAPTLTVRFDVYRTIVELPDDADPSRQARVEEFLELIAFIYEATDPRYVFGDFRTELGELVKPESEAIIPLTLSAEVIRHHRIDRINTLMLFPPAMVAEYGSEWLHNLPAAQVEKLDDGGLMIRVVDPFDPDLGLEEFYEAKMSFDEAFHEWPDNTQLHVRFVYDADLTSVLTELETAAEAREWDVEYQSGEAVDYVVSDSIPRFPIYPAETNFGRFTDKLQLELAVHLAVHRQNAPSDESFEAFLDVVRFIYHATEPLYAYGMLSGQLQAASSSLFSEPAPISDESLSSDRIEAPTLLMLFPPAMADYYERVWLQRHDEADDPPIERIERLEDGGLLVVTTDAVLAPDLDKDAVDERMEQLRADFAAAIDDE